MKSTQQQKRNRKILSFAIAIFGSLAAACAEAPNETENLVESSDELDDSAASYTLAFNRSTPVRRIRSRNDTQTYNLRLNAPAEMQFQAPPARGSAQLSAFATDLQVETKRNGRWIPYTNGAFVINDDPSSFDRAASASGLLMAGEYRFRISADPTSSVSASSPLEYFVVARCISGPGCESENPLRDYLVEDAIEARPPLPNLQTAEELLVAGRVADQAFEALSYPPSLIEGEDLFAKIANTDSRGVSFIRRNLPAQFRTHPTLRDVTAIDYVLYEKNGHRYGAIYDAAEIAHPIALFHEGQAIQLAQADGAPYVFGSIDRFWEELNIDASMFGPTTIIERNNAASRAFMPAELRALSRLEQTRAIYAVRTLFPAALTLDEAIALLAQNEIRLERIRFRVVATGKEYSFVRLLGRPADLGIYDSNGVVFREDARDRASMGDIAARVSADRFAVDFALRHPQL